MKTIFKKTMIVLAAMMATTGAWADNDGVLISEDFEDYTLGNKIAAEASSGTEYAWWTTWSNNPGSDEDGMVGSDGQNKYGHFTYGNDQVLLLGNLTTGQYELSFDIFLPEGKDGYFNILHVFENGNDGSEWALQCFLNATSDGENETHNVGFGTVHAGGNSAANISCVSDAWMHFRIVINMDADKAQLYVTKPSEAEKLRCEWKWSLDSFGNDTIGPGLAAMNFWPPIDASNSEFYVDNIVLRNTIEEGAFGLAIGSSEHGTITFTNEKGDPITTAKPGEVVTVTVAPDEGYDVDSISGECSTMWEAAAARSAAPGLLQSYELTPVDGVENQWTFTMKAAKPKISATYKHIGSISYKVTSLEKSKDDSFINELEVVGDGKVTYSISGSKIATVDEETGRVTITDAPGVFAITATVENGEEYVYKTKTATYVVSVGLPLASSFINDGDDPTIVACKMALATVLRKAKEIETEEMTPASTTALETAIDNAEEALDKKDVTTDELEAARMALLKAIDEMEKMGTTGLSGKSGLSGISGISGKSGGYYDLQGRKVKSLKKGVYLYKGKKVKK